MGFSVDSAFPGIAAALAGFSLTAFLPKLLLIVICIVVVKLLLRLTEKLLKKSKLDPSLHAIIRSVTKILLLFVAVMIVAASFGIDVTSLLAVLSIVGVAVSLSIQGILGNFFSGITLLMSKPFKVGDFVTIGGMSGTIVETGLTHTKLHTVDNQVILVPNSTVTSNTITNVSAETTRRVDLVFTASYDSDPDKAIEALTEAAADSRLLPDEPVFVRLSKYGESSVEYTVRVWVNAADYWDVYFDIIARVRPAFQSHGVEMTYPHVNIHTLQ